MAEVRTGPRTPDNRHVRDIGPAAAGAVDGIAAMGRLSAVGLDPVLAGDTATAGAGPVERSHVAPLTAESDELAEDLIR